VEFYLNKNSINFDVTSYVNYKHCCEAAFHINGDMHTQEPDEHERPIPDLHM
jgi:hypothetical protein